MIPNPLELPLIEVGDATHLIIEALQKRFESQEYTWETILLQEGLNRITVGDIFAPQNYPRFPTSIMDGYAIFVTNEGSWNLQNLTFNVLGSIFPGAQASVQFHPFDHTSPSASYIATGAPVPPHYNLVIPIEDCIEDNEINPSSVRFPKINSDNYSIGKNIRAIGSDIKINELLVKKNTKLGPIELSLLAQVNIKELHVYREPVIKIISIGDELIQTSDKEYLSIRSPYTIIDSNEVFLSSALKNMGLTQVSSHKLNDNYDEVESFFEHCIKYPPDLIISTGGASVGRKDYIRKFLTDRFTVHFSKLNLKPGKPTMFATHQDISFFGLPGNPVSVFVIFNLLVKPFINALTMRQPIFSFLPPQIEVILTHDVDSDNTRPEWKRCLIFECHTNNWPDMSNTSTYFATVTGCQISSRLMSCKEANGLVYLLSAKSTGKKTYKKFDKVRGYILSEIPNIRASELDDDFANFQNSKNDNKYSMNREQEIESTSRNTANLNEAFLTQKPTHSSLKAKQTTVDSKTDKRKEESSNSNTISPKQKEIDQNPTLKLIFTDIANTQSNHSPDTQSSHNTNTQLIHAPNAQSNHTPTTLMETTQTTAPKKCYLQPWAKSSTFVLTISTSITDLRNDLSGATAKEKLLHFYRNLGCLEHTIERSICKDNIQAIQQNIIPKVAMNLPLIITSGGTGATYDDVTPEAILPLISKRFEGIETLIYNHGFKQTPKAALSRTLCGQISKTIIVCLPGSPNGVIDGIDAISPILHHLLTLVIR